MKSISFAASAIIAVAASAPAFAQHTGHAPPAPTAAPTPPPPAPPPAAQPPQPQTDHSAHQMPEQPQGEAMDHAGHAMPGMEQPMTGALGAYPISREASGTAWQPDASIHGGLHATAGEWMLMGHLTLNGVYDWQEGRAATRWGSSPAWSWAWPAATSATARSSFARC